MHEMCKGRSVPNNINVGYFFLDETIMQLDFNRNAFRYVNIPVNKVPVDVVSTIYTYVALER